MTITAAEAQKIVDAVSAEMTKELQTIKAEDQRRHEELAEASRKAHAEYMAASAASIADNKAAANQALFVQLVSALIAVQDLPVFSKVNDKSYAEALARATDRAIDVAVAKWDERIKPLLGDIR